MVESYKDCLHMIEQAVQTQGPSQMLLRPCNECGSVENLKAWSYLYETASSNTTTTVELTRNILLESHWYL